MAGCKVSSSEREGGDGKEGGEEVGVGVRLGANQARVNGNDVGTYFLSTTVSVVTVSFALCMQYILTFSCKEYLIREYD